MLKSWLFGTGILFATLLPMLGNAQEHWTDEDEIDSSGFFIGVNIGAFFPNNESSELYIGAPGITPYDIEFVMQQPFNQQAFDNYFIHPREVVEYPIMPMYRDGFDLGLNMGYKLSPTFSAYMDLNLLQLDFEQFFTIAIQDPNNGIPGPTLQQFPIFGEENRFNLNLGLQVNYYYQEGVEAYIAGFGNLNGVQMERNYFVINDVSYEIFHFENGDPNQKPGGLGYGGGAGTGLKLELNEDIWVDLNYNLYYTQINLTDTYQPFNTHHSLGLRVLWK